MGTRQFIFLLLSFITRNFKIDKFFVLLLDIEIEKSSKIFRMLHTKPNLPLYEELSHLTGDIHFSENWGFCQISPFDSQGQSSHRVRYYGIQIQKGNKTGPHERDNIFMPNIDEVLYVILIFDFCFWICNVESVNNDITMPFAGKNRMSWVIDNFFPEGKLIWRDSPFLLTRRI